MKKNQNAQKTDTLRKDIIEFIAKTPHTSAAEIGEFVGLSRSTARYHVLALIAQGHVTRDRRGIMTATSTKNETVSAEKSQ